MIKEELPYNLTLDLVVSDGLDLKKKKKKKCCEKFRKKGKGCCKSCPINWV